MGLLPHSISQGAAAAAAAGVAPVAAAAGGGAVGVGGVGGVGMSTQLPTSNIAASGAALSLA